MNTKILKNNKIISIRQAQVEDAPNIVSYFNLVGGQSDNLLFGKNQYWNSTSEEIQKIKRFQESNSDLFLCGFINQTLSSICVINTPSSERVSHNGEVILSVAKQFWGLGIGTCMLEKAINLSRENNLLKVLHLGVRSDNYSAINIYKNLGFKEIGIYKDYFKIGGKFYDKVLMNLYLK